MTKLYGFSKFIIITMIPSWTSPTTIVNHFKHCKTPYNKYDQLNETKILKRKNNSTSKLSLYKRLPIPGTNKFITLRSSDIRKTVDIYFNHKKSTLRMTDIMKIRTLPDVINVLSKAQQQAEGKI